MFCRNCGKEIDDKAYVCIHCGCLAKSDNSVIAEKQPIVKNEESTKKTRMTAENILITTSLSLMCLAFFIAIFIVLGALIVFCISLITSIAAFIATCVNINRQKEELIGITLPLLGLSIFAIIAFAILFVSFID